MNKTVKLIDQFGSEYHFLSLLSDINLVYLGINKYSVFYPMIIFNPADIPDNFYSTDYSNNINNTLGIYNYNIGYPMLHNDYSQSKFSKFMDLSLIHI